MKMQNVLIIEDDNLNAEMMRTVCNCFNTDVTIAINGKEGLDCILNNSYDLVLLDLRLPYVSGMDIARAARNNAQTISLPIIAMSADYEPSISQKALAAGCNYFFPKPINVQEVRTLIQSLLQV